ncbi:MAG: hypothetical protein HOE30_04135 [Deltaproteobacteria bacterium]|jgi:hypothetical protein|nr:hypothetical protein [Deltaproteobacteria bacterium]MBT4087663.1 hypothetical protein [Deltaproteobacteria bacterium]MBT4265902.1 hypothetical protein [Deltaproteobacteria bacterium]MBT4643676.1 hypothetical protein [Deltaproteobacteria bacterium]MBT6503235.1 hypothetical protein [Deltaproteobacteria bacterium]
MSKKVLTLWISLLLTVGVPVAVNAIEYRRIGQDYRSLAMGNTGIASANNSAALFYNPAAMANIFTWWVDLPFLQVSYSDDAAALYDMAQNGSFNLETQEDQINFMNDFIGQNPFIKLDTGANLFINLDKKGLTVAANYTYEAVLDIEVRNPSLPEINSFIRLDHIRQTGVSIPLGLGKLVLGVSYKVIERQELDFTYDLNNALANDDFPTLDENGVKGSGSGYDVGFLYRTATTSRIMIGGVWRKKISLKDATDIPEEYALGLSTLHSYGIFRLVTAMDWRDITNQQGSAGDKSINRRLHFGLELGILPLSKNTSWITLRSGYNQGYFATQPIESYNLGLSGVEIALGHSLILGYTKYIEETGEYAGQKPSPRTVIYLSLGF